MPQVTFQTLQQRVETRVIDLPSAVLAEIPTLINDAIHWICGFHNFRVMLAETAFVTTAATHTLGQIPADWKEPRSVAYYVANAGWTKQIEWQPSREYMYRRWEANDPLQVGPPRDILLSEAESVDFPDPNNPDNDLTALYLQIWPFSDGRSDWPDGQYRVKVPYWRYLPDLAASTDHNWFSDWGDQFIIGYATWQAFLLDWDEARAAQWMEITLGPKFDGVNLAMLGGWARDLLNRDKSLGFAPGKVLVPRRDVNAEVRQWRT